MRKIIETIALDLEGTLISNAVSQIPRPYLLVFLEGCKELSDRIVMFTTVSEVRFRQIAHLLVSEGTVPAWFEHVEYINWSGEKKDLTFIPHSTLEATILVDDVEAYIAQGQDQQWLYIEQFANPYSDTDCALLSTLEELTARAIKTLP